MDILSHGLWGGIAFGRKSRSRYWLAFLLGVAPDLLSFGIFFFDRLFTHGFSDFADRTGPPDPSSIPLYVYSLYDATHSLVVFATVFALAWFFFKKPMGELGAWGLHILVDIPTHSDRFFPTPFLWPVSDFHVNGRSWGTPEIFFPNVVLLLTLYFWYFKFSKPRTLKAPSQ